MASAPVPTIPSVNSRLAKRPAAGSSALAASAAVSTWPPFAPCSTVAVATMIANITATAEIIPAPMSPRIACTCGASSSPCSSLEFLLDLFARLPEEQVRRDRGAQDGDDRGELGAVQ